MYVLHMVFSTRCCGCGPKEPVCSLVHCNTVFSTRCCGCGPKEPVLHTCTPEDGHIDTRNM